jgi:hypothetical protein
MSWLQFIDSMVGRLAWPIVVLIVIVAVRRHLGSLTERILELSFGGATLKFEKLLSRGAEIIQEAPVPQLPKPEEPELPLATKELPSKFSPTITRYLQELGYDGTERFRVIPAYETLTDELARLGEQLGVKTRDAMTIMRMLEKRGLISSEMVDLFDTLRQGRNAVAHAKAFPTSIAIGEYSRQAGYLLGTLRRAEEELQKRLNEKTPA